MHWHVRLYVTKVSDGTLVWAAAASCQSTVVIVDVTKIYSHLKRSVHIDIQSLCLDMMDSRKSRLFSTCKYKYFQFKVHIDRRRCLLKILGPIATWEADTSLRVGRLLTSTVFEALWISHRTCTHSLQSARVGYIRLVFLGKQLGTVYCCILAAPDFFFFWYQHAFKMTDRQTQTCQMDWNRNQFHLGICSLLKTQMLQ